MRATTSALVLCAATLILHVRGKVTVGINLSGLEEGGKVPGRPYYDYAVPSEDEWSYFASKDITLVRLPFKWERMQPNASGPLEPAYAQLVHAQLAMAANNSMRVVLDCHNFGGYHGQQLNHSSGNATTAFFADFWTRMAAEFGSATALAGYDIMNEPSNMPDPTAWPEAAQAAIHAIRAVDTNTPLYVEGDHWSSAANWSHNNPTIHTLTDTLCTNKAFPAGRTGCIVWSAHCYLDRDNSGTHFNWTAETEAGVTVNTGVERLADFATWLHAHKFAQAHIGELGAGNDNVGWLQSLNNSMSLMANQGWELTYWAAGPWFSGSYGYDVDARTVVVNGNKTLQDKVQMAVLSQHSGAPPPLVYFLEGPTQGHTMDFSLPFTLTYRGYIDEPVAFSCYLDTEQVFTTTCSGPWNCAGTFQVNASIAATHAVYCKNNAGLTDPPRLQYNASGDLFLGASATVANVFSLRHLYKTYDGPLLTLRRGTDNQTANFTFASDGELDTAAILAWCSPPCEAFVDTWYDQSPHGYHAGRVVSDFHGGGNKNVSIFDQPQLVMGEDGNMHGSSRAHIHFNGQRRMDAKSPVDGLTGQTLLAVMSANGTGASVNNSDRLLSWAFVQNIVFPMNGGYVTSDSPDGLPLNISHTPGWHRYVGRWRASVLGGKSTWKDGAQTACPADEMTGSALHFQYRDVVNIGWFRWWSPVFAGDVREVIVFGGAISNGDIARFDASEKEWLQR